MADLTEADWKRLRITDEQWKDIATNGVTMSEDEWLDLQDTLRAIADAEDDDDDE
jgi:hypothetical protein